MTLGKLFTHTRLCYQAAEVGTGIKRQIMEDYANYCSCSHSFLQMKAKYESKYLRFSHWLTLCTLNIHLLTYLLTYLQYERNACNGLLHHIRNLHLQLGTVTHCSCTMIKQKFESSFHSHMQHITDSEVCRTVFYTF